MAEWDWVMTIGRKLRQDLGDFHGTPPEMLSLITRLRECTKDCEKSAASMPAEAKGEVVEGSATLDGKIAKES